MYIFICRFHRRKISIKLWQTVNMQLMCVNEGVGWIEEGHSTNTYTQRTQLRSCEFFFFAVIHCPAIGAASLEGQEINWREQCKTVGGRGRVVEMWRWRHERRSIVYIPLEKSMEDNLAQLFVLFFFRVPSFACQKLIGGCWLFFTGCASVCIYVCARVYAVCVIAVESAG